MARGGGQIAYAPSAAFQPQVHPLQLLAQVIPQALQVYQQTQEQEQQKAARQQIMDQQTAEEDNAIRAFTEITAGDRNNPLLGALQNDPNFFGEVRNALLELNSPSDRGAGRVARQRLAQLWRRANDDTGDEMGVFAAARANQRAQANQARQAELWAQLQKTRDPNEAARLISGMGLSPPLQEAMFRQYTAETQANVRRTTVQADREEGALIADRGATAPLFGQLGLQMPEGAVAYDAVGKYGMNQNAERRAASFSNDGGRVGARTGGAPPPKAAEILSGFSDAAQLRKLAIDIDFGRAEGEDGQRSVRRAGTGARTVENWLRGMNQWTPEVAASLYNVDPRVIAQREALMEGRDAYVFQSEAEAGAFRRSIQRDMANAGAPPEAYNQLIRLIPVHVDPSRPRLPFSHSPHVERKAPSATPEDPDVRPSTARPQPRPRAVGGFRDSVEGITEIFDGFGTMFDGMNLNR